MKSLLKKYKSILGLNTVKAFIVVMLSLAIIAVVTLIVLGNLVTDTLVKTGGLKTISTNLNESHLMNGTSPGYIDLDDSGEVDVTCDLDLVTTEAYYVIDSGNYTQSNCRISNTTSTFQEENWLISYVSEYNRRDQLNAVSDNVSTGIISFFANATTYFALLGVVVIILIISLVVVVVNRFGGATGGGTGENPSL